LFQVEILILVSVLENNNNMTCTNP